MYGVKSHPFRTSLGVSLVACSGGAQVLAGLNGSLTWWQLSWFLLTVLMAGVGGLLVSDVDFKRIPRARGGDPTGGVSPHKGGAVTAISSTWQRPIAPGSGVRPLTCPWPMMPSSAPLVPV